MWNPCSVSSRNASAAASAILLAFAAWLVGCPPAHGAQEELASVEARVDRSSVTIGDPITYEVIVKRRKDIQLQAPVGSAQLRDFEIKGIRDIEPVEEKGHVTEGRRFTMTTYEVGEYVIEGAPLTFRFPDGKTRTLSTERLYVSVKSVIRAGEKEPEDIRGIKGVVPYVPASRHWLLAAALLACAGAASFVALRRRRAQEAGEATRAPLSSHDEAFQALSKLYDSDLLRRGDLKGFSVILSEILRRYLERRFSVPALESTTFEIHRSLRDKALADELQSQVLQVLSALDLVKFAKDRPAPTALLDLHKRVKAFVTETQERTASEPAATAQ